MLGNASEESYLWYHLSNIKKQPKDVSDLLRFLTDKQKEHKEDGTEKNDNI